MVIDFNRCAFHGLTLSQPNSFKSNKIRAMKNLIRIILACFTAGFLLGCSAKEEAIFCLSDDYSITSKAPVLKLSNTKFSKETEGIALLILSVSDSLSVNDWDLLSLTMVNKAKGDTLVNYSSFRDGSITSGFEEYRSDIDVYVKNLKISLKEAVGKPSTKKVQITVNVRVRK
jgi:hypothetical protein